MATCQAADQPVVIQGGLTGLAGAACVLPGELAISLERMRGIEEVDLVSGTMTVLAGTTLQEVQQAAEDAGAFFPLDLGSRGSCTIGGVLGTNAGGNRVIKYGMARDQILDIEAVLADGRIIGGLSKMIKNNTGLDLRNLLIGSEGTAGVITRAVLRLRAKPLAVSTAWCGLPDFAAVTTLLRKAQASLGGQVSVFEVMWPNYVDFVCANSPALRRPLAGNHAFHVILETDGTQAEAQEEEFQTFLAQMIEDGVVDDAVVASSIADARRFWDVRDAPAEFPRTLPDLIAFDISFAVADIDIVARRSGEIAARWPNAQVLQYGHLGDGNLHLVIDVPGSSASEKEDVEQAIYALVSEYRGSVSAEHGIGMKKRDALPRTRTDDERSAMASILMALDPHAILNRDRVIRRR